MDKETSKGIENLESTKSAEDLAVSSENDEEYSEIIEESECRAGNDD